MNALSTTNNESARLMESTAFPELISMCSTTPKRVSDELREMADEASREHEAGKTEEFPK